MLLRAVWRGQMYSCARGDDEIRSGYENDDGSEAKYDADVAQHVVILTLVGEERTEAFFHLEPRVAEAHEGVAVFAPEAAWARAHVHFALRGAREREAEKVAIPDRTE